MVRGSEGVEFLRTRCPSRRAIDKRENQPPVQSNQALGEVTAETHHESEALQASESPKQSVGGMASKGRERSPNGWITVSLVPWVAVISAQGIEALAGFKSNLMVRGWMEVERRPEASLGASSLSYVNNSRGFSTEFADLNLHYLDFY